MVWSVMREWFPLRWINGYDNGSGGGKEGDDREFMSIQNKILEGFF
jgi:hypothetical protein